VLAWAALNLCAPTATHAETIPGPTARAIAIAEDQRRWDSELKHDLSSPSPAVRARAALAVGRLQDSTTVPSLAPLLDDPAPEVRREAVFALGQIRHPSARPSLEARLDDRDAETVVLALEALGKLGDRASTARVTPFLDDRDPGRRGTAAVALWRLADSTALDALLGHHADPDPAVRWRVLYALEKIAAPDRVVLRVALHLGDKDPWCRAYAARTLGRQKSARGTAYLLQALDDPETAVAVNALRALQQIADTTCAHCAVDVARMLGHAHPYVRVTAATALAERGLWVAADSAGRAAAQEALAAHLVDPDAATRGACARALLARRTRSPADAESLLRDSSLYARVAVLEALTLQPGELGSRLLLERLGTRFPLFERMTAAEGLGTLEVASAIPALRAGLADSSALFVSSCAAALAELGDSASVPALATAYAARAAADADVRIAIRDALRGLASRAFADSLERRHAPPAPAARSYPPDFADEPGPHGALLHTTRGDIEWSFFRREAPQTVRNFVRLAERGYFDGLAVHRVVPNFVIQDGDPTGTGSGGPGYTIRCEYNRLRYEPGMVGMALSGKDTGGSQWFITHSPQPHLDGRYTIFARVAHGMDVVQRIVQGDRVLKVEILK
jgi:cyclophilin family peptidyl-prolyl cis-trans isomerase/HEAT repeat protein